MVKDESIIYLSDVSSFEQYRMTSHKKASDILDLNNLHVEARGYYGYVLKNCIHCKEYAEIYDEGLWKVLNGLSSEFEFDWEYLDFEDNDWFLHVCRKSNIVAFLKSIVIGDIV